MALNYSAVYWLDKNKTKHTISTMYRYKKGEGTSILWASGSDSEVEEEVEEVYTPTDNSYFTFTLLGNGTYSIAAKDYSNMPSEVFIPNTYEGKAVTAIADKAFCDPAFVEAAPYIETVYIPNSITSIGEYAFFGCTSLSSVRLSQKLTTIRRGVFGNCPALAGIIVPISVITIDRNGFAGACDNLTIYCEATEKPSGWEDKWNSFDRPVVWGYKATASDYFTFTEQADGTYSVKATDVSNLPSEIYLPLTYKGKAVTAIDYKAFNGASGITKVVIPNSVTSIGNTAFQWCTALTEITLPSRITAIGEYTFFQCAALIGFTIPESVTSIGTLAFAHTTFATIIIPLTVTTMGEKAFFNCTNLTINCEAASQPEGWDTNWNVKDYNSNTHTANWGYTS